MDRFDGIRRLAVIGVLLAVLGFAAFAQQAQAQGYAVEFDCNRSDGWTAGSWNENFAAWRDCGGAWLSGMKTYAVPHTDGRTSTGMSTHTFRGPAGTAITGIDWEGYKYFGGSSFAPFNGWSFKTGMIADNFRDVNAEAHCYTDNVGSCFAGAGHDPNAKHVPMHAVRGMWDSALTFYTQCAGPNPCSTTSDNQGGHNLTRAGLVLSRGRVHLADLADPTISSVGGSVLGGGWKRGTVDITVTADDNSGVCQIAGQADDSRQEIPLARDTYALKQCGGVNAHPISWNTTNWPDGDHRVAVWAWDAAGRAAGWGWHTFRTDNTAPGAPGNPSIDGGEAWSQSNSRTVRWANPSQGAGSPIAGSQLQVCKTGTTECRTHEAGAGGIITGAAGFDGPGDYTVRLSLKDGAGNHNANALSNGVRLRFDNLAPGAANPTQSNGWLNAEERAGYQQTVALLDDAFVPVSGIRGYSLATDGSDPDNTVEAEGARVSYPINDLPEGVNTIKARSVSHAGVGSTVVSSATVRVDLTKPTAHVDGAPDPAKWQSKPVDLVLKGADQAHLSGMEGVPNDKPLEEGAYIAYKVDAGELQKARGSQVPVTVADEGEHTVTYYAVDLAGNKSDTETVQFKIDRTKPAAHATSDSVDPEQWQRESVTVTLTGDDGAGKSGMDPAPADEPVESGAHLAYRLNTANVQKARGGAATFRVEADGDHAVAYRALDGAGNESEPGEVRFRVDKTAPGTVVLEEQRSDKRRIEVSADDATAGVGEVQIGLRRVGTIAAERRLRYLARRNPSRYRSNHLRATRRAGNRRGTCARKRGRDRRRCVDRRRRIVTLGDDWRMLPAIREGDKWVAYVPNDKSLVEGVYQLQAIAMDHAGNEASADRFRGGQPAIIPIRDRDQRDCCGSAGAGAGGGGGGGIALDPALAPGDLGPDSGTVDTKIAAGAVRKVKVPVKVSKKCRKPKTAAQKKKCKKARRPRYREEFVNRLAVKFRGKAKLKGSLTTATGAPIADGTIDVISTPNATGHVPRLLGAVTTDASGSFSYTAPAGTSRTLTFRFRGLREFRRSAGDVTLLVPASATLKRDKPQVRNGQSVAFSGKLLGKPLPSRGKVVDLQVFYRGKWRTFATPRANRKGQFKFRYRFEATRSTSTYRFRARLRAESAYPYELGYSKVVTVKVRGA
jgi:hypothetical protein